MRIGLTGDFIAADGGILLEEAPLRRLESLPGVELVAEPGRPMNHPLDASDVSGHDVLICRRNRLTADLLARPDLRLGHVARMGVGYDHIDIEACTRAGVLVSITPEAVRRPIASAILTLMLAFAHRLFERDRLARAGDWRTRFALDGIGLGGRTLGLIGAGNIGKEVVRLVAPFGMRLLIHDPGQSPGALVAMGAAAASLEQVLREADFLVLACPLDQTTRGLINAERLALMKPTAFLDNMARGELVEEAALVEALQAGRLAGAGIDVFTTEPPAKDNPLFALSNVIVGQHNLGMTDELERVGQAAVVEAVIAVAEGRLPEAAVNPEARPELRRE